MLNIKYIKRQFPNGTYIGQLLKDKREGHGEMKYNNHSMGIVSYNGFWKNNKWDKYGKICTKDGIVYNGEIKSGLPCGSFIITYQDGSVCHGSCLTNIKTPYVVHKYIGNMKYKTGDLYRGTIVDNMRTGYGKMIFTTGDVYQGYWLDNKQHGYGKMMFKKDAIYEGDWERGRRHGEGKMVHKNGDIYSGEWDEHIFNGKIIYKNGSVYFGKWNFETCTGEGKMLFSRVEYNGKWINSGFTGEGTINYKNDNVYEGTWDDNGYKIKGKMIYKSGDIYDGVWKDNVFWGEGYIHSPQNHIKISFHKNFDGKNTVLINEGKNTYLLYDDFFAESPKYLSKRYIDGLYSSYLEYDIKTFKKLPFNIDNFAQLFNTYCGTDIAIDENNDLTDEEKEAILCPVTLDIMVEPIITTCNHAFCKTTIEKCNNICPFCRRQIIFCRPNEQVLKIYERVKFTIVSSDVAFDYQDMKDTKEIMNELKQLLEEEAL